MVVLLLTGDKPKSKSKSKQEEKSSALAKGSSSRTDGHKPNSKEKEPKLVGAFVHEIY